MGSGEISASEHGAVDLNAAQIDAEKSRLARSTDEKSSRYCGPRKIVVIPLSDGAGEVEALGEMIEARAIYPRWFCGPIKPDSLTDRVGVKTASPARFSKSLLGPTLALLVGGHSAMALDESRAITCGRARSLRNRLMRRVPTTRCNSH